MKNMRIKRSRANERPLLLLAPLLVTLLGCIDSPGSQLIGRWQGRPESIQDRTKDKDASAKPTAVEDIETVLEKFDFTMTLDFVDASRVRMVMDQAGQSETKLGSWMLVSASDDDLTIQITPDPLESGGSDKAASHTPRQFLLKFDKKNKNRFLLTELNADSGLGAILFERNASK